MGFSGNSLASNLTVPVKQQNVLKFLNWILWKIATGQAHCVLSLADAFERICLWYFDIFVFSYRQKCWTKQNDQIICPFEIASYPMQPISTILPKWSRLAALASWPPKKEKTDHFCLVTYFGKWKKGKVSKIRNIFFKRY